MTKSFAVRKLGFEITFAKQLGPSRPWLFLVGGGGGLIKSKVRQSFGSSHTVQRTLA